MLARRHRARGATRSSSTPSSTATTLLAMQRALESVHVAETSAATSSISSPRRATSPRVAGRREPARQRSRCCKLARGRAALARPRLRDARRRQGDRRARARAPPRCCAPSCGCSASAAEDVVREMPRRGADAGRRADGPAVRRDRPRPELGAYAGAGGARPAGRARARPARARGARRAVRALARRSGSRSRRDAGAACRVARWTASGARGRGGRGRRGRLARGAGRAAGAAARAAARARSRAGPAASRCALPPARSDAGAPLRLRRWGGWRVGDTCARAPASGSSARGRARAQRAAAAYPRAERCAHRPAPTPRLAGNRVARDRARASSSPRCARSCPATAAAHQLARERAAQRLT